MKSLLSALQEGRLVELPDPNKEKALEFLALLIEAIPDAHPQADIVKEVKQREAAASTALGKGIACPHARRNWARATCCARWDGRRRASITARRTARKSSS